MSSTERSLYVALFSFVAILGVTVFAPEAYRYDEPYHLSGAKSLVEAKDFLSWLKTPTWSAAGPLYSVLHAGLAPITGFEPLYVRLVSNGLAVVAVVSIYFALRTAGGIDPAAVALVFGIPSFWSSATLAMTEMPAVAAAAIGLTVMHRLARGRLNAEDTIRLDGEVGAMGDRSPNDGLNGVFSSTIHGLVAGICFGAAAMGRQSYIVLPPLLIGLGVADRRFRIGSWIAALITSIFIAGLFAVWGGTSPPNLRATTEGFLSLEHGALAFAYLGLMTALVNPRFFVIDFRTALFAIVVASAIQCSSERIETLPMRKVAIGLLGESNADWVKRSGGFLPAFAAAQTLASFVIRGVEHRRDSVRLFAIAACLMTAATAAGVTLKFSSRYVAVAIPFMLSAVVGVGMPKTSSGRSGENRTEEDQPNVLHAVALIRTAVGAAIGLASSCSYLYAE